MLTPAKAAENIRSVRIQGARNIAIYALKFLRDFAKKNGFGLKFEVAAMILENARPTAVVFHNAMEIVKKDKKISTIDKLIKQLENSKEKIAKIGQKLIKNQMKIITHCHSGETLGVMKYAHKMKKKISIIATETEPLKQGIRTVKELSKEKVPVTLIVDSAAGFFMKNVDAVFVGSDAIRREGFVNKIGTLQLAIVAKEMKKPFYVVGNTLKFDRRKNFKIEERPANEVFENIKGVKIRNPAFDLVPWKYVTAVITEKGIFKPEKISRMIK